MFQCSIIIPIYNRASLTRQCLDVLLANPPGGVEWEIIVVDDASTDRSHEVLLTFGDQIQVITHDQNCGFATSCNHGAAVASGEFLVFLNNDTIPKPGWLDALVRCAGEYPKSVAIGSKLLFPNQTVQHAGIVICQDGHPRHLYMGFPAQHPSVNRSRQFQAVTGACMLVRHHHFEQLDGFDTGYCNGYEDVDLCLRLRERGYEIRYCHESVLYHLESVSPGRFQNEIGNAERYRQRWIGKVEPDDLTYYLADGLLHLNYAASYPFGLEVSPLLATLNRTAHHEEAESLLNVRTHQVDALLRENIQLLVQIGELGLSMPEQLDSAVPLHRLAYTETQDDSPLAAKSVDKVAGMAQKELSLNREQELRTLLLDVHSQLRQRDEEILSAIYRVQTTLAQILKRQSSDSPEAEKLSNQKIMPTHYMAYQETIRHMRRVVDAVIPACATVIVISKGDEQLLDLGNRPAWHFPQNASGEYAGHYPKDSAEATAHLEALRLKGAEFLLIPSTAQWWLDYYSEFEQHLESQYSKVISHEDICVIYGLQDAATQLRTVSATNN